MVENFFDIIYNVHVELEGRPGKHAGQKRTYRTVSISSHNNQVTLFSKYVYRRMHLKMFAFILRYVPISIRNHLRTYVCIQRTCLSSENVPYTLKCEFIYSKILVVDL